MKNLFNLLIVIGILTLIGTMGASDVGTISMSDMLSQISLSFTLMLFGFAGKCSIVLLKSLSKKYTAKKKAQRYSYLGVWIQTNRTDKNPFCFLY